MTSYFSLLTLMGLMMLGLLPSCNSPTPTPAVTAIQGQVSLITSVLPVETVALSSTTAPVTTTLHVPANDGSYRFESMPAGIYTISFMPASGYLPAAAQTVRVTTGTTNTVPIVTPDRGRYRLGSQSFAEYRVDAGIIEVGSITARQNGNSLQLSLEPEAAFVGKQMTVQLLGFADQVGTFYTGNQTVNAHLVYSEVAGTNPATWSTSANNSSASVVVTDVTLNPRRVSGTFTAVVTPALNATANRMVVGYFSQVPY